MAEINAQLVGKLREASGARLMDCKKALSETGADAGKGEAAWLESAQAWLRKHGQEKGDKMAGKAASEGLLGYKVPPQGGCMTVVEMTANTDFVAKNPEFLKLLNDLVEMAEKNKLNSAEQLNAMTLGNEKVVDVVRALAGKIGENISIKRVVRCEGNFGYYVHHDNKQGAIVEVATSNAEKAREVGKDIAMHIVFAKPAYLKREEVPQEAVAKEKEIVTERLKTDPKNANKPAEILSKIADGQLNKFFSTLVLPDQAYYKENSKTVAQVLKEADATVTKFVRFHVGVL